MPGRICNGMPFSMIESFEIEEDVEVIESRAFMQCLNLEKVSLPNSLKEIKTGAFMQCSNLKEIEFPSNLEFIGSFAFYSCDLEEIILPSNIKVLYDSVFQGNFNLKKLVLNEGLKFIKKNAFCECLALEEVKIPQSVMAIGNHAFETCLSLNHFELYDTTRIVGQFLEDVDITIINSKTGEKRTISGEGNSRFVGKYETSVLKNGILYFFDNDNRWVELDISKYDKYNLGNKGVIENSYRRLYEWLKRGKFLPHSSVIENMPISEIDNFYLNNNCKRWDILASTIGENGMLGLIKALGIESEEDERVYQGVTSKKKQDIKEEDLDIFLKSFVFEYNIQKTAMFKLCYVLGLFDKNGSVSQKAFEFIENNMLSSDYHVDYNGLAIRLGYNKEFAELVFKYYKDGESFIHKDVNGDLINMFSNIYNNFEKIKKTYPNKKVRTNRKVDQLTVEMCIDALMYREYDNVEEGNEEFAKNISRYGYSQEEFEHAQRLFDIGKNLDDNEITLFASKDNENNLVTYELLDKDNPLGVVVGDITNCCQTLNGSGKECVEYGLSKKNSKFMVFRVGNKIIGQSWVWYDEKTKKVCLDNIEVPKAVLKNELAKDEYQKAFIDCLTRCANGFIDEMSKRGFEIDLITIGEGFNDVKDLLTNFTLLEEALGLTGYEGYSDAEKQFVLYARSY